MTDDEFRECLEEYYQGEVLGEAFFEAALRKFEQEEQQYKICSLLQLETETKARLRPYIIALGGSVEELDSSREAGRELAKSLSEENWTEFLLTLNQAGEPLTERQREVAKIAPKQFRELADSMRIHGESIQSFSEKELAGDGMNSITDVVAQLRFPLST